jgi:hypothetical protein
MYGQALRGGFDVTMKLDAGARTATCRRWSAETSTWCPTTRAGTDTYGRGADAHRRGGER